MKMAFMAREMAETLVKVMHIKSALRAQLKQHHNTKPVCVTFVLTSVLLSTPTKGLAFIELLYFNS